MYEEDWAEGNASGLGTERIWVDYETPTAHFLQKFVFE